MTITPSLTSEYCMFMLLMALGSLAETQQRWGTKQQWAEKWAQPAFSMIPKITMENDLTAVHCLILFRYWRLGQFAEMSSLYHMWILNPAHAYNMICLASDKLQRILERFLRLSFNAQYQGVKESDPGAGTCGKGDSRAS